MTQVVKSSKSGFNVLTETGVNNFIFDSTKNTFKILAEGTLSATVSADGQIENVAHGKSYTPSVFALCKFPDDLVALPNESQKNGANALDRWFYVDVDATNIKFTFQLNAGSSYAVNVKYYVFETPAV